MKCLLRESCVCRKTKPAISMMFCQHARVPERVLRVEELLRFQRLPDATQQSVIAKLRTYFSPQWLDYFREQATRGMVPGSDFPRFHIDDARKIRNAIRDVAPDSWVPTGNWDDYYIGAMVAAVLPDKVIA